jgi:hypothetical protein
VEKRKFLNLLGLEMRPFGRPARSQSLYRLRYPEYNEVPLVILALNKNDKNFGTRRNIATMSGF